MSNKIMAIGTLKALTPEQQQTFMPKEVPATLTLYLEGKMDQFWFRTDGKGVIFLMNTSEEETRKLLKGLPLGQASLLEFELLPVGPLAPLALLLG